MKVLDFLLMFTKPPPKTPAVYNLVERVHTPIGKLVPSAYDQLMKSEEMRPRPMRLFSLTGNQLSAPDDWDNQADGNNNKLPSAPQQST